MSGKDEARTDLFEIDRSNPQRLTVGPGWDRVVELLEDHLARPHEYASWDAACMDIREAARGIATIIEEEGNTDVLLQVLLLLALERAGDRAASVEMGHRPDRL